MLGDKQAQRNDAIVTEAVSYLHPNSTAYGHIYSVVDSTSQVHTPFIIIVFWDILNIKILPQNYGLGHQVDI